MDRTVNTGRLAMLSAIVLGACGAAVGADKSALDLPVGKDGSVRIEGYNLSEAKSGRFSRVTCFGVTIKVEERLKKGKTAEYVLAADAAVIWIGAGETGAPGKGEADRKTDLKIYAEGEVVFTRGTDRIRAARLIYDFSSRKGYASECRIDTSLKLGRGRRKKAEFVLRAEEAMMSLDPEGPREIVLKGMAFSDCTFAEPHYDLAVSEARISAAAGKRFDEGWLTAEGLAPRFFGIPWFYFPVLGWKLDWRPLVRLHPGFSSEYGFFLDSAIGMRFLEEGEEESGNEDFSPGGTGKEVARLWLPLGYFEKRGVSSGGRAEYKHRDDSGGGATLGDLGGEFDAFYIRDRGDKRGEAAARGLYPLEMHDRWRVYLWHRQEFLDGLDLDLELNSYSDRNFLLEFFEDEWKKRKPPESYALLRSNTGSFGMAALAKYRMNPFAEEVEYLPRLRFWLMNQDLVWDWLDLGTRVEVSRARRRTDDSVPGLHTEQGFRFDVEPCLSASGLWGPLAFSCWLKPRFTAFEISAAPDGDAVNRTSWEWGFKAISWAWRFFEFSIPWLGIGKLMHVVTPQVEYRNLFSIDARPADLVRFDEIEEADRVEKITFRLENRVIAHRTGERGGEGGDEAGKQGGPAVDDALLLDLYFDYFPKPDRDNGGEWFSPLRIDFRVKPASAVSAWVNVEYDMNLGKVNEWNLGASASAGPFVFSLTSANVAGSVASMAASLDIKFSPRYSVKMHEIHDFRRGEIVETGIKIKRIFHCWVLECGLVYDRGERNTTFLLSFMPALFADRTVPQEVGGDMFR